MLCNPLIYTTGCLATAGVLTFGLFNFVTGNSKRAQLAMRARVIAQGLTLVAATAGMVVATRSSAGEEEAGLQKK